MQTTMKTRVRKLNMHEGSVQVVDDTVAIETPIHLLVNRKQTVTLFSLPSQLKELGVGWLFSQGIVRSVAEITAVKVKKNIVRLECSSNVEKRLQTVGIKGSVESGCGSAQDDFALLNDRLRRPLVKSGHAVKATKVLDFLRVLNEKAVLFRKTGGTHSAAIFHDGLLVAFAEDIGRHNAVDKAIGAAAMKKTDFSECVMVSSGRQTANMVLKAARTGIPIVISISGPVSSGIVAAKKTRVTLVCFARGQRMNVYSQSKRIKASSSSPCGQRF